MKSEMERWGAMGLAVPSAFGLLLWMAPHLEDWSLHFSPSTGAWLGLLYVGATVLFAVGAMAIAKSMLASFVNDIASSVRYARAARRRKTAAAAPRVGWWARMTQAVRKVATRKANTQSLATAEAAFAWLEAFVPKRIANEELGDALEFIGRMIDERRPRVLVRIKIATTCFWVLLHTGLHYSERVAGIWSTATGKNKD
jgi:hypothetical protein